jgi:hypothetical protein
MVRNLTADKLAIRETVENWVLWRDAGDWERFATVWHSDGWMTATWFQGPAQKFIDVSREGFDRGVSILHFLGGWTCEIAGNRAISQIKMTINQRAPVEGVLVDVVCTGRFYDFFEKRQGRWGIVRRQPICSGVSPRGIATWPISRQRTGSMSKAVSPAYGVLRWRNSMQRARPGLRARFNPASQNCLDQRESIS